ncbi:MAG: hypothetical protein K2L54_00575 [Clostridiales bacterium]|nr:hypothetical protein [Clostridiales bacterium]
MKLAIKKKMCIAMSAVTAFALCGCNTETAESTFDKTLPWHDSVELAPTGSYELLNYSAAIYDTSKGVADDKRVKIADGSMSFELKESTSYTSLEMNFSVTYNDDAPEADKGKTDTIHSIVEFEANSLAAKRSEKTVTLADREGKQNLSYKINADYFDEHKATYILTAQDGAKEKTHSLPKNTCRDNEMMFYIARAQNLATNASNNFKMVNLFDTFNLGNLAEYRMAVACGESKQKIEIGDWVKEYGGEAVTDESTGVTTYPISCFYTTISINDENHGPPYVVHYAETPFKSGGKEHKKIPIRISYSQYTGSSVSRVTEYNLTSCSFDKAAE